MKIENIEYTIPTTEISLGEEKTEVKHYLPTKDKSDLLNAIKEWCFELNLTDQPKMDALLNVLIVLNYTDIEFESRDPLDLLELYDYLEINDYIAIIIEAIPEIEYEALIGYYRSTVDDFNKFKMSGTALFANIQEFGPALMEKIGEMSKEVDVDAIKLVADISSKFN